MHLETLHFYQHGFDPGIGKVPQRRKWQPTPVFLPGESQGQRSLAGYSPWGHKESETNVYTRLLDSEGEGEGGMIWENGNSNMYTVM